VTIGQIAAVEPSSRSPSNRGRLGRSSCHPGRSDVEHLAGDAAKGLQLHQPRLRLMDIPRNASGRRAGRYCQGLWMGLFQATSASVDLMGARVLSALNRVKNPNQTSWVVGAVVPLYHPVTDAGFNLRSRIGTNVPTPFTVRRNASKFPRPAFR
jgi:hypothetical protein